MFNNQFWWSYFLIYDNIFKVDLKEEVIYLSVLKQILAAEQQAIAYQNDAELTKQKMLDEMQATLKQEEEMHLNEAKTTIAKIISEREKTLSELEQKFQEEMAVLKADLVKDLNEKIDKSLEFLWDKVKK